MHPKEAASRAGLVGKDDSFPALPLWWCSPGKLCLQHEELARESIPVLVQELEVSQEMPVRINVVTALCDLCMLYTSLVDRYIPNISLCLRDPHPVIHEHALTLLTNLLQVSWG